RRRRRAERRADVPRRRRHRRRHRRRAPVGEEPAVGAHSRPTALGAASRAAGLRMKTRAFALVAALAAALPLAAQQPPPPSGAPQGRGRGSGPRGADPLVLDDHAGFDAIFDGTSLKGWDGDPTFWRAENGAIVGESTPDKRVTQNTFIIWRGG